MDDMMTTETVYPSGSFTRNTGDEALFHSGSFTRNISETPLFHSGSFTRNIPDRPLVRRRGQRTPVCARCGHAKDRGLQYAYCRACHNTYARLHRPKQVALDPEAKRRANVRAHTKMLVRRGQLTKTPCACGALEVTAVHHPAYADPRAVTWACRDCRLPAGHTADAVKVFLELAVFLLGARDFLLRQRFVAAVGGHRLEVAQPSETAPMNTASGTRSAAVAA